MDQQQLEQPVQGSWGRGRGFVYKQGLEWIYIYKKRDE